MAFIISEMKSLDLCAHLLLLVGLSSGLFIVDRVSELRNGSLVVKDAEQQLDAFLSRPRVQNVTESDPDEARPTDIFLCTKTQLSYAVSGKASK